MGSEADIPFSPSRQLPAQGFRACCGELFFSFPALARPVLMTATKAAPYRQIRPGTKNVLDRDKG
jgi:hypothetical protein